MIYQACHREHLRTDESGRALTENQARVLDHLHDAQPMTLSKLAEHMGIGRSAASITVKRLIRAGYIKKTRGKDDRRCVGLTLSAAGLKIQEHNTVLNPALVEKLIGMLGQQEAEQAIVGMERLARCAAIQLKRRTLEVNR